MAKTIQLKIFAVSVPKGNWVLYSLDTPNLERLPSPPPKNMANSVVIGRFYSSIILLTLRLSLS